MTRINRVIDHIDAHLDAPLNLDTLASIAHVSSWHFHRVFQALTGETLAQRVRRRRLEVAANRLLLSPREPALRIALDVGFASAEVFSRTFKAHFGCTPTTWRRTGHREWAEHRRTELSKIHQDDRNAHQAASVGFLHDEEAWPRSATARPRESVQVRIRTLPPVRVAYMRHVGPYGSSGLTRMWQRFAAWTTENGLMTPRRTMYGVSHDSPDLTSSDKLRYDACIEVGDSFAAVGEVGVQSLPGGRYACMPFIGTSLEIHSAWMRFVSEWLPGSVYQCDDRDAIEVYDRDFAVDPVTSAFGCTLCIPIRPA